MQKGIVYVALILAIVVIFCAIATMNHNGTVSNKSIATQTIKDVKIQDGQVTTNIWDYLHEQQSKKNTIGSSENASNEDDVLHYEEPQLTVVLK